MIKPVENKPILVKTAWFTVDNEEFEKITKNININSIMNRGPLLKKKASRSGYDSLTNHEKNILKAYSYIEKAS